MGPIRPFRIIVAIVLCSILVLSYHWRLRIATDSKKITTKAVGTLQKAIPGLDSYLGVNELKVPKDGKRVPLEAHIMSKCPDAQICLNALVVPTMVKASSMVDFKLSFIGTPTDADDGVECKHGPTECLGNIVILCAAELYPDPKQYLGFANCLISRFPEIPQRELVSDCALEYGMSMTKLNDCASDSTNGMQLLRKSVLRSKDVGAALSCTVRLNEEEWCIVDGGQWKQCKEGHEPADLIKSIKKLYDEKK